MNHQKWPGDGSLKIENFFEHTWQPEKGLVTSFKLLLFF